MRAGYVTVVSGVPRSGTSLLMQMLCAGGMPVLADGVRAPDADNPRGYFEYEPARGLRRDASWLARAEGSAVKVVHLLVPALPPDHRYRLILVRRELTEVLASQRAMLARRGIVEDDLPDERLAAVFRAQLAEVERWAQERPTVELLCVDYTALLADAPRTAAELDRFLGGGLDCDAMAASVDPALHRQRA
jgi:hypothetical protein